MTNPNNIPERDAAARPPRLPNDAIEKPLGHLEHYEIADGYPDIRGWELYGSDGHQLGSVTELLADPGSRRVTQAVVDVDGRKTTVPIEFIHLDEAASRAFVSDEGVERTSLRQSSSGRVMASPPPGAAVLTPKRAHLGTRATSSVHPCSGISRLASRWARLSFATGRSACRSSRKRSSSRSGRWRRKSS